MQRSVSSENKALVLCLSVIVFLGAFLLFEIEPLTGKIITPMLGGTSAVWIVCLLFFQLVVLGGYLLTFLLARLPRQVQVSAYIVFFAVSLMWARIPSSEAWSFQIDGDPTWALLAGLMAHLAFPCIVLSSISGTMQVWQAAAGSTNPYRLYSLSNLGSLGALLLYPTVIEPLFPVTATLDIWKYVYYAAFALALFAGSFIWRDVGRGQAFQPDVAEAEEVVEPVTAKRFCFWLFLSTLGSAGLLAFTSYLTTDIAPVPLLWVLPLAIYLLSFIVAFGKSKVNTDILVQLWIPMVVAEIVFMAVSPLLVLIVNLILLFQLSMVTSVELVDSKPAAKQLPTFYLAMAIGGALGGILVALVAPLVFSFAGERNVVILIFTLYKLLFGDMNVTRKRMIGRIVIGAAMSVITLVLLVAGTPDVVHRERNFFGSVAVKKESSEGHQGEPDMIAMYHGRVKHGLQYTSPDKQLIDVYPYGPPASLVFAFLHKENGANPLKAGVVGLGAGSMAAEVREGDELCFYEIDPKVKSIAEQWFSYLKHSKAKVSVEIGDGRLLIKDSGKTFDGLCIDAFSGDAVPVHLLTVEAMQVYLQHIKEDGFLFFHCTNAFLDLAPIIGNLAEATHLHGCLLNAEIVSHEKQVTGDAPTEQAGELGHAKLTKYVVLCRDQTRMNEFVEFAKQEGKHFSNTTVSPLPTRPDLKVWTDDYSNLFSVFKWQN